MMPYGASINPNGNANFDIDDDWDDGDKGGSTGGGFSKPVARAAVRVSNNNNDLDDFDQLLDEIGAGGNARSAQ